MNGGLAFFRSFRWSPNSGQPDLKINRGFASIGGVPFVQYTEQGGGFEWKTSIIGVVQPTVTYDDWEDEDPETDYEGGPSETDNMPQADDVNTPDGIPEPPIRPRGVERNLPRDRPVRRGSGGGGGVTFAKYRYKSPSYGAVIGNVTFKYADSAFSGN